MNPDNLCYESPARRDPLHGRPGRARFEARVMGLRVMQGRTAVMLDRSPFFPGGGGQGCDHGFVGSWRVENLIEEKDGIWHLLEPAEGPAAEGPAAEGPAIGDSVNCEIDVVRRRDQSEQHSAQHLLSATVLRLLGGATKSFHLGEAYSSIDVDLQAMDREDTAAVEDAIRDMIAESYPIVTHVCDAAEASRFPLRRSLPADEDRFRIVEIDGLDFTPCCGTHLPDTGGIRAFRILSTERYKGMTRIQFVAGARATADYASVSRGIRDIAATLGCSEAEAPAKVADLVARTGKLEERLAKADRDRIRGEAERIARRNAEGPRIADGIAGWSIEDASELSRAAARLSGVPVIAVSLPSFKVAVAGAESLALGTMLKPLIAAGGGKGGGGPGFVQASFGTAESANAFAEDAKRALGAAMSAASGNGEPR